MAQTVTVSDAARMKKINFWQSDDRQGSKGGRNMNLQKHRYNASFSLLSVNYALDIFTKTTALKASPFVVGIKIYSGHNKIRNGCGFVIESSPTSNNNFECVIITSNSLLRVDHISNLLLDNLKFVVIFWDGKQCTANLEANDFHFNIAALKVEMQTSPPVAALCTLDDSRHNRTFASEFQLHPHSNLFRLVPGIKVIALGRHCDGDPYHENRIMAASGVYSIEEFSFDCKELLGSTCRITKCGIGGPLVNEKAEIIGMNFFDIIFTPFLPSNTINRWWKHFKQFRDYCRPWVGMEFSSLHALKKDQLEMIIMKFPHVKTGVVVDEVTENSPAHSAKVIPGDVIVECDGKAVHSTMQFYDELWDKVGKSVNLVVMRAMANSRLDISMMVTNIRDDHQFNHWPLSGGG